MKLRQDATTAAVIIEQLGGATEPTLRKAVELHFSVDEEQGGEHGLEFLQGFYSGLYFAHTWMLNVTGNSSVPTRIISDLLIEAARKYTEQIEKQANKP